MKSLLHLLAFLTVIMLQFSCKKDKADSKAESDLLIEHPSGFSMHFQRNTASPNILDVSKEEDVSALLQVVNRNFSKSKSKYIALTNFKLDLGVKYSYLIFEGYDKSTKLTSSFAYLIELDPGHHKALFKTGTSNAKNSASVADGEIRNRTLNDEIVEGVHKCTGDPCSCCAFSRNEHGIIVGCNCKGLLFSESCPFYWEQLCNHELSGIADADGDGVEDEEDECPTIPGPISNMGCPENP